MKIIFWGTPKYAAENLINIVREGQEVIAVVTQPDKKRGRGNKLSPSPVKEVAIKLGIPVFTTRSISKDKSIKEIREEFHIKILTHSERRIKKVSWSREIKEF